MNNTERGVKGEALVLQHLIEEGYEVFLPFGGKTNTDLVAERDGTLYRVQVKSTSVRKSSGRYVVQIKKVRSNKTKNNITSFNNQDCDILAVAILPENRVILLDSKSILSKNMLTID